MKCTSVKWKMNVYLFSVLVRNKNDGRYTDHVASTVQFRSVQFVRCVPCPYRPGVNWTSNLFWNNQLSRNSKYHIYGLHFGECTWRHDDVTADGTRFLFRWLNDTQSDRVSASGWPYTWHSNTVSKLPNMWSTFFVHDRSITVAYWRFWRN